MTTHHLALSRTVAASPQRVWQVITDLDRAAQTLSGVSRVERLTDGPYALGTRWRETRTMFGKATTEEMWVTALDPARSTTVEASSHGTDYRTVFDLTPTGSGTTTGTELTVRFSAQAADTTGLQKLVIRVFGGLALRATRTAMQRDLDDIATAAESSPG